MLNLERRRLFLRVAASNALFESFCARFFSSAASAQPLNASLRHERDALTLSYLINSCGLNPEAASIAAKKISLKSAKKSDLVLKLFREHGFTDARITKMVTKMPTLLLAKPEKTLMPKLEFFRSIGMSPLVLSQVVCLSPSILGCSLKRRLIPFHSYIKELLHSDKKVIDVYKHAGMYCINGAMNRIPPNVAILRKLGVSESKISFLLVHYPISLTMRPEKLVELIEKVVALGIDVSKLMFVQAIQVLHHTSKVKWERSKRIYKSWGWSESDILKAFKMHSNCMTLSEKKITSAMEFLVKEMKQDPRTIASSPTLLLYSLKNRIVPRCRVVQILMARGLIQKSYSICTLASVADRKFKEKFVTKYEEEIPQLMDVYVGKLSPGDLGLSSNELARLNLNL